MSRANRYRSNEITYLSLVNSLFRYGQENQRITREIVENNSQMQRFLYQLILNIPNLRNDPGSGINRVDFDSGFNVNYMDNTPLWRSFTPPVRATHPSFSVFPPGFFDPVNIVPTSEQISRATSIVTYGSLSEEEQNQEEQCPITLTPFTPTSSIMRINACGHYFMAESLQRHFRNNSRCPICRTDIRDISTTSPDVSTMFTQANTAHPREGTERHSRRNAGQFGAQYTESIRNQTQNHNSENQEEINTNNNEQILNNVSRTFINSITEQLGQAGLTSLNNVDSSNNTLSLTYSLLTPRNILNNLTPENIEEIINGGMTENSNT